MTGQRIVAIFAHPDDESLVAGGTLAACAAAGVDVTILCLTRGEQGPIAMEHLVSRDALGDVREQELRSAGSLLGACTVECLRYADGDLTRSDTAQAAITRRLRQWRPDVVITFGPEGLYWHPDHVAVHRFTVAAVEALTSGRSRAGWRWDPWLYYATCPHGWMTRLASAAAARGLPTGLWGVNPEDFGVPRATITTVVDVRRFLPTKLRALRTHRTQLGPDHLFRVLPDELAIDYLGREYFVKGRPRHTQRDWLTHALPNDGAPLIEHLPQTQAGERRCGTV